MRIGDLLALIRRACRNGGCEQFHAAVRSLDQIMEDLVEVTREQDSRPRKAVAGKRG